MAAKSSSVVVAYAVQADKDTPATGAFTALSKRSGGFSSAGDSSETGTSSGRHEEAATLGSVTHSGSFEFDFGADIHDAFLQSAYAGVWAAEGGEDRLSIGSTPLYFTFVVYTPYITTGNPYTRYAGCQVSAASFSFPKDSGAIVGLNITLGVANRTFHATAPWGSLLDAPAAAKLKTCDVLSVKADGVEIPSVIDSLDYNISSENESIRDIRQCDPVEVLLGNAKTSGTLAMLHDNYSNQWHVDAASATEFELEMGIDTGTTDYRIVLPRTANLATGPDYTNDNVTVSVPFGSIESPSIYRSN